MLLKVLKLRRASEHRPGAAASEEQNSARALKSQLHVIALAGFAALVLCAATLSMWTGVMPALLWLLAAAVFSSLVYQQTSQRLHLNRRDQASALFADLGWANGMTLGRGWLIAATGGCLVIPAMLQQFPLLVWIAAAAYSIAAVFDRIDGYVARKTQRSTLLGAELDTVFDALGLAVAPLLALQLGKIPAAYLLVSVAYYFFVSGVRYRQRHHKPVYPLAPSKLRRTLAGFQMAYIAVVLWPPFQADVTIVAGFGFMLPLLAGFLLDWCVVSGRINVQSPDTARRLRRFDQFRDNLLLPGIRLFIIPLLLHITSVSAWSANSCLIAALSALMIVTGLAGRSGAMILLFLLAWTAPVPASEPSLVLLLIAAIAILLLGCGRFSLWQADDDWVNRQDGA